MTRWGVVCKYSPGDKRRVVGKSVISAFHFSEVRVFDLFFLGRIPTMTMREWRIEFHWIVKYTLWSRGGSTSTTYKAALEETYLHPLYTKQPVLVIFEVIAEELNTRKISLFFCHLIDMIPTRERYIKLCWVIKIHKRESGEESIYIHLQRRHWRDHLSSHLLQAMSSSHPLKRCWGAVHKINQPRFPPSHQPSDRYNTNDEREDMEICWVFMMHKIKSREEYFNNSHSHHQRYLPLSHLPQKASSRHLWGYCQGAEGH